MISTNKTLLLAFMAVIFQACGGDSAENQPDAKSESGPDSNEAPKDLSSTQFGIKAGHVEYTYTGKWTGTQSLWWDNWGDVAVLHSNLNMGVGSPTRQKAIWKDGKSIVCDLDKADKTCYTTAFRVKDSEPTAFAITAESDLSRTNWTRLPDEAVAGKTCEVFENTSLKVKGWRWNRVELKYYNGQGDFTRGATSFEQITAIPADILSVPDGYSVK
jgi:hypothetical protein